MRKELLIPFDAPLNAQDTETQTYGCRQNNPNICGNNSLPNICAFVCEDGICKKTIKSLEKTISGLKRKPKPLNYRLYKQNQYRRNIEFVLILRPNKLLVRNILY